MIEGLEELEVGEKKKFFLTNGYVFTIKITKITQDTIFGIDKFGQEIFFSKEIVAGITSSFNVKNVE
ncbi:MAG: hypothetical protein AABX03_02150 [Nanoarchaeota archaeon]